MKIRIYSLLLCGFALGSLSALAQQSPLLEKYRTMALLTLFVTPALYAMFYKIKSNSKYASYEKN